MDIDKKYEYEIFTFVSIRDAILAEMKSLFNVLKFEKEFVYLYRVILKNKRIYVC